MDDVDAALEIAIDELLDRRAADSSICPSEAARVVDTEGWRELMPAARAAAGRLAQAGSAEVTRGGQVVDGATARGPVRVRRAPVTGSGAVSPAARSSRGLTRCSTNRRSASAVSVRCTPGMASTCSVIRQRSSASRATTSTSRSATPDSPVTSTTSGMWARASLTSARLRCTTVTVMYAPSR